MTKRYRALTLSTALAAAAAAATLAGCDTEDPAQAVVESAYPELPDGGDPATRVVVYKVWWAVTLFNEPVLPGASSLEQRAVPYKALAFALLAPGWDPESGEPPTTLVPVESRELLTVKLGETLRISVSDETFGGNCAAGQQLPQAEADFITQRIFPSAFAGTTYDARTCTTTPIPPADGGTP